MRDTTIVVDADGILFSNDPTLEPTGEREVFLQRCRERGFVVLYRRADEVEECGQCGHYHVADIPGNGDCRDDEARFCMI